MKRLCQKAARFASAILSRLFPVFFPSRTFRRNHENARAVAILANRWIGIETATAAFTACAKTVDIAFAATAPAGDADEVRIGHGAIP